MRVYAALRWNSDEAQEVPEVCLFESIFDAADWLFDFQGGEEEEDYSPLRQELYSFKRVSLDHGVELQILNLTVKR